MTVKGAGCRIRSWFPPLAPYTLTLDTLYLTTYTLHPSRPSPDTLDLQSGREPPPSYPSLLFMLLQHHYFDYLEAHGDALAMLPDLRNGYERFQSH